LAKFSGHGTPVIDAIAMEYFVEQPVTVKKLLLKINIQ